MEHTLSTLLCPLAETTQQPIDGFNYVGHRVKVVLQDIRRSYAVGDVILPGSGAPRGV